MIDKTNIKKTLILSLITFSLTKENVDAKTLNDYLNDQVKYYTENPLMMEYDINQNIMLYQGGYGLNLDLGGTVTKFDHQLGDFVYVNGIGNIASDGTGKEIEITHYESEGEFIPRVIVGIKSNSKYPYAIANYDEDTKSPTSIVGWFKDESIVTRGIKNYEVIEAPVYLSIKHKSKGDKGYTKIANDIYLKTYYSDINLPKGYYLNNNGYYVNKDSLQIKRQSLNNEQMKLLKKYKIDNN